MRPEEYAWVWPGPSAYWIVEQRLRLGLALADFSPVSYSMFDSSTISFSVSRSPDGLMMSARYEDNPGPPIL